MSELSIAKVLALVVVANGAPVLASRFLPEWLARPIDGGRRWRGRPLLGPSKTWRGALAAVAACALAAPLLGLPVVAGVLAGVAAMAGDVISSFIKRRSGVASSDMALGLDQVPESLLPTLALLPWLPLGGTEIVLIPVLFLFVELVLSQLMFRIGIRKRPY